MSIYTAHIFTGQKTYIAHIHVHSTNINTVKTSEKYRAHRHTKHIHKHTHNPLPYLSELKKLNHLNHDLYQCKKHRGTQIVLSIQKTQSY